MLNKMPIRIRLTILNIIILIISCIGLTFLLNISANSMADVIQAVPVEEAKSISSGEDLDAAIIQDSITTMEDDTNKISQNARSDFFNKSIFFMIVLIVIGGVSSYYISGYALIPLKDLNEHVNKRTIENLGEELKIPDSQDEIAELTNSFNNIFLQLDESFVLQRQFSHNVAHELRTPLTIMQTKIDVFRKKERNIVEYNNLIDVLDSNTKRLSFLVKDLLDFSNLDKIEFQEDINSKELFIDIFDELKGYIKEKNLTTNIVGSDGSFIGNKTLIHRAFYNIIENAIKYNNIDGYIKIEIKEDIDDLKIEVKDSGIGITADIKEKIFKPFYREDIADLEEIKGSGIGLSISKSIISKHNGNIIVKENHPEGTIVKIQIEKMPQL